MSASIKQLKLMFHTALADITGITAHAMVTATMTGTAQVLAHVAIQVAAQTVKII